jgi:hypothetical protein
VTLRDFVIQIPRTLPKLAESNNVAVARVYRFRLKTCAALARQVTHAGRL